MENNYWHKMVVLTGLTLFPSTLALTSAVLLQSFKSTIK